MKALRIQLGVILSSLSLSALASAQAAAPAPVGVAVTAEASTDAPPVAAVEAAPVDAPPPAAVVPEPVVAPEPVVVVEVVPPPPPPGPPSFKIEIPDGVLKVGILAQPQLQVNSADDKNIHGSRLDFMVRRARVLIGGTVLKDFDYFFDTDFANILTTQTVQPAMAGGQVTTARNIPGMNITDIFFTYHPIGDVFKVDLGYMLPAGVHNAVQGAGSLYGLDYFGTTFTHQVAAFGATTGRDAGLQLRGLVVGGHLEYRLGVFQGARRFPGTNPTHVEGSNFFRTAGRLQVNILDAEPGFFYAGTYLGKKKILSAGGFFDFQDKYRTFGGDVFADLPIGPGTLTGQLNFVHRDAGSAQLKGKFSKANVITGELGYNIAALNLSPIVKLETTQMEKAIGADVTTVGGGIGYWPYGHTSNIKAFFSHSEIEGAAQGAKNFTLQWQLYFY